MVKLLGMLSVLISAIGIGFVMAKELNDRTKALKEIYQSATSIKTELEYRGADICDCFNRRGVLFSNAYKYIKAEGYLPAEAVKKAAAEISCLKKEDIEAVNLYADNLYTEDLGGQIANINLFLERLRGCIRQSEEEYNNKNRLYKSGGAIAGLGFIILLL